MLEAGDEVLAVLDPGVEEDLKQFFGPDGDEGADGGTRMRVRSP